MVGSCGYSLDLINLSRQLVVPVVHFISHSEKIHGNMEFAISNPNFLRFLCNISSDPIFSPLISPSRDDKISNETKYLFLNTEINERMQCMYVQQLPQNSFPSFSLLGLNTRRISLFLPVHCSIKCKLDFVNECNKQFSNLTMLHNCTPWTKTT